MSLEDEELLQEMITESKEHLATIEPDLLLLETHGSESSEDVINRLFRTVHSIKGGFSFMGMMNIANLAHGMETALGKVRDGELTVDPKLVDALFKGIDKLSTMIDNAETSESLPIDDELALLSPFISDDPPAPEEPVEEKKSVSEKTEPKPKKKKTPDVPKVASEPVVELGNATVEKKGKSGQQPGADGSSTGARGNEALRIRIELLDRLMNLAGELVLARNQMMSVLNQKVSEVMGEEGIAGEMEAKTTQCLSSIIARVEKEYPGAGSAGNGNGGLQAGLDQELSRFKEEILKSFTVSLADISPIRIASKQIDQVTSDIQGSIMHTRLQPVGTVFSKLPRLIRDLSRNLGKQINLEITGKDVEVDKSIIEALSDPLVHIIRNCGDHAIETPDERMAAGKVSEGSVSVNARHDGGQVLIEIIDDGRGIDPDRVKAKAVEKGIITSEAASSMPDSEAQRLIFAPGFSTAVAVSDVSGRGVGMDVVRTNIESLGGAVELESNLGSGTRLTLKLPLTMAIIPSLIVTVGSRRFAIPQTAVEEFTRIRGKDIPTLVEKLGDSAVIRRRGRLLPLVRLADILGTEETFYRDPVTNSLVEEHRTRLIDRRDMEADEKEEEIAKEDTSKEDHRDHIDDRRKSLASAMQVVVLRVDSHRFGLVVDSIQDIEEIVVKPLSRYIKGINIYSGATIMGDGKITMILDPNGLSQRADLRFDQFGEEKELDAKGAAIKKKLADMQKLLLFTNNTKETFVINVDLIARIDKITSDRIEIIGDKEFVRYKDHSMRVIRLHDYLPVNPPEEFPEEFLVLVPRLVRHTIGIIVAEVKDVVSADAEVDKDSLSGDGIFGTSMIDNTMAVFIDIYKIYEKAAPELYKDNAKAERGLDGKKVLLAEDTAFFRAITTKYLEDIGLTVKAVIDGQYAWEELMSGNETYDILITDVNMPRMNGFELTRKVRASRDYKSLPIVALTSMTLERDRTRGLESGVTAYEHKLDKDKLIHTLKEIL